MIDIIGFDDQAIAWETCLIQILVLDTRVVNFQIELIDLCLSSIIVWN